MITQLLINQGIDTIIIACHTSSATSLNYLQQEFPHITFVDMIMPTILAAENETENNTVGVIATPATIESNIHKKLFQKHFPYINVHSVATPQLVPFIENQQVNSPECFEYLKRIIHELQRKNIDTLILGCTHYPFIEKNIKKIDPKLKIVSAAYCVKNGHKKTEKDITFFVSGNKKEFEQKIKTFLNLSSLDLLIF